MSNNRAVCAGIGIKLLCQAESLVQLLLHAVLIIRAEPSRSLQPCLVDDVILVEVLDEDLGVQVLSLAVGLAHKVVVIRHAGRQAALGVDRCLQVGLLPTGGFAIPGGALRQFQTWSCFPVPSGQQRDNLAAFGLALDPASLVMTP